MADRPKEAPVWLGSPTTQPPSCAGDRLSESTWSTDNRIASPKCPMLTVQSWRGIWPMSNNELSGQAPVGQAGPVAFRTMPCSKYGPRAVQGERPRIVG